MALIIDRITMTPGSSFPSWPVPSTSTTQVARNSRVRHPHIAHQAALDRPAWPNVGIMTCLLLMALS
jgi:hypothetical protein